MKKNQLARFGSLVSCPPTTNDQNSPQTSQLAHDRDRDPGAALLPLFRQERHQPDSLRRVRENVRAQSYDDGSAVERAFVSVVAPAGNAGLCRWTGAWWRGE